MIKPVLGALLLATTVAAAEPTASPTVPAVDPPSIQAYGDKDAACEEWVDGCRACGRSGDGAPVCSNIGIACQPKAVRCTVRKAAPNK